MPKDYELDLLKAKRQEAFDRKQIAFERFIKAKEAANLAYDVMQAAWKERCDARSRMNHEFEAMQSASERYRDVWGQYGRIRDYNNARIEELRREADSEHQEMVSCFERASSCFEYGSKAEAKSWSEEGHMHKARRNELNAEVGELIREIKDARQSAEWRASKTDGLAFQSARDDFMRAKERHAEAQNEFKRLKTERDRAKAEFDSLEADYKRAKEVFRKRLDEVRGAKAKNDRKMADKVDMALMRTKPSYLGTIFGHNAKIVPREDGSGATDIYFAGLAEAGDGLGHGHAVIDRDGNVTYLRDAWSDHRDYLINDWANPTHK